MTGRQFQNLNRVINKYKAGKLDKAAATLLLRNSFGLSDEDIETLLVTETAFSADYTEDDVTMLFEAVGEPSEDYTVVKSRPYRFEEHYDEFADIKQTDSDILNLIGKDKRITPEVIGSVLKLEPSYVAARIKSLEQAGVLTPTTQTIGVDTIIERAVNQEVIETRVKPETIDVYIKYSYEAKPGLEPVIATTRPFCRKLISMNKVYTRAEIESISQRIGFSVWDRKGGFWGSKDECRHRWVRQIVIKKKK
jgi:DNA-binding Lrp family transcriptional regulator